MGDDAPAFPKCEEQIWAGFRAGAGLHTERKSGSAMASEAGLFSHCTRSLLTLS